MLKGKLWLHEVSPAGFATKSCRRDIPATSNQSQTPTNLAARDKTNPAAKI